MLNEWQEFLDYTGPVCYQAVGKRDTTWLGRFTFEALRDFSGLARILTILARGFLFHTPDGAELPGDPRSRLEKARKGLCAWCSVPEKPNSRKTWQYHTGFPELHGEFPKLVDEAGLGWFARHFHSAMDFAKKHPNLVRKSYAEVAEDLDKKFDRVWRDKVRQFQTPLSSPATEGAWVLRFDDMIADALELGPLRRMEADLPAELAERLDRACPETVPPRVLNFDCYFGDTNFGRKYLAMLPDEVIQRNSSFGVSRYRVREEYLSN